jgi:quinol monooxygenase YgiN
MPINLTVIIKSKLESIETMKSLLQDLFQNSRKEAACIQYDLHQNLESPTVFIFHEVWEDKAGLDNHNQQVYIKSFLENSKSLFQEPTLIFNTTKI